MESRYYLLVYLRWDGFQYCFYYKKLPKNATEKYQIIENVFFTLFAKGVGVKLHIYLKTIKFKRFIRNELQRKIPVQLPFQKFAIE